MYNRYIPQDSCTPVEPPEHEKSRTGKQTLTQLLKGLRLDRLDSGDLLLALVVLLLWKEREDSDLLLALGAAMLIGDGENE